MPRLRPYEQQLGPQGGIPSRDARATDVAPNYVPLGQAIESGGYAAGHAQALLQDQENRAAVTDVHTMLSRTQAFWTQKAAEYETKANPKDNNHWEQFAYGGGDENEPAEGSLKHYLESYKSQITNPHALSAFNTGAETLTTNFSNHFVSMQSRMAGVYAKQQATAMLDAAQTTVQTDPSLYAAVVAQTTDAINDPNSDYGRLSAEQREPIKRLATEQISKSAMQGMINIAPEQALRQLTNNTHGMALRGEDVEPLIRSAETSIRAKDVEARRVEAEAHRQKVELHHATDQSLMAKYALHASNPSNPKFPPLTATEIGKALNEDRLDGGVGRAMLNMIEEDAKAPKIKTDQNAYWALFNRIHAPVGDPKRLTDLAPVYDAAGKKRQLSPPDMERLRKEFLDARTPEGEKLGHAKKDFLDGYKTSIDHSNPLMGKIDTSGGVQFSNFQYFVDREVERYTKENKDPAVLFNPDPNNGEFLGRQVGRFQKPIMDSIKDVSKSLQQAPTITDPATGATPQDQHRLPGETPQHYLDRMKK